MPAFPCPSCQKKLSVKDDLAGKKVQCPGCKAVMQVPQLAPVSVTGEAAQPAPAPPASAPAAPSLADCPTAPPVSRAGEATATGAAPGHDASLTSFLAPSEASDELGRLGGFRILKVLGHGGMGVVFQGEDPRLGRKVAIKAMLPHLAGSDSSRQRFLGEARAAAALEHDHVVAIHHVGEDRGAPFIVMPFLKGEPLDRRLQRERPAVAEILRVGREIAQGLAAAHAQGLIHRDIKPANVWLEAPAGRVKILDFGLARAAAQDAGLTQEGAIIGTPAYMAPEQARGEKVDARCDLWSLGVVLYRMCTGQLPFRGADTVSTLVSVATDEPPAPAAVNPAVPAGLSGLVMCLLEKDPARRVRSADAVAEALRALEGDASPAEGTRAATPPRREADEGPTLAPGGKGPAAKKPAARKKRTPVLLVLVGVLAAALLAAGVVAFRPRPPVEKTDGDLRPDDGAVPPPESGFALRKFVNSLGMEFVLVGKGKFLAGGGGGKAGEKEVAVPYDYWLGACEVTQGEWDKVMGANPSFFSHKGGGKAGLKEVPGEELKLWPVESVSWTDAGAFVYRINEQLKAKESGWVYRLPTEAEWEYACRGGPLAMPEEAGFDFYPGGPAGAQGAPGGNFNKAHKGTRKVGSYAPNRLGLYDMHGNVAEWCHETVIDPKQGALSVNRGGGWEDGAAGCRAAGRSPGLPSVRRSSIGLRLARVPLGTAATADVDRRPLVNLLPLFDPARDAVAGSWTHELRALSAGTANVAVVEFPYRPPAEYDFRVEFTCHAGVGQVNQFLARQDSSFSYHMGADNNRLFGLERVAGKAVGPGNPTTLIRRLSPGDRHVCLARVRNAGVTVEVDGKEVARWDTDYRDLSLDDSRGGAWPRRDRSLLGLGSGSTDTRFTRAEVVEVGGRGLFTRPADPASRAAAAQRDAPAKYVNRLGMEFVLVGRGTFRSGRGKQARERKIPHDFYLGAYEVTQEEWTKVMASNPSAYSRQGKYNPRRQVKDVRDEELRRFPVESVSWDDCQGFIERLNAAAKETDWVYRLPREVEWEYACRGGPLATKADEGFDFYLDRPANALSPAKAHYNSQGKGRRRPKRVGSYPPNRLGLYDMHGNVAEWCADNGPTGSRWTRGGSMDSIPAECRAGARTTRPAGVRVQSIGLRLARVPVEVGKK